MVELVPDILNEIVFELVLGLKADDFRERAEDPLRLFSKFAADLIPEV